MRNGALVLADYPLPVVRIECERCGRAGRYGRGRLIERFGPGRLAP